jgi:DNA helicase II / ATP-dependent DNA helicase PcrA
MSDRRLLKEAINEMRSNPEQYAAVHELGNCVLLAGPGGGKTKTLTTAMARALLDDVIEPRGIACITYNNECALELETRLARLAIEPSHRVFIGTVHSFALSAVISPYARCVLPELPLDFRVASRDEARSVVQDVYNYLFHDGGDPHARWRFAEDKRKRQPDRTLPEWRGRNAELADFIEGYEAELRRRGLIDFDDMPLLAYRMVQAHPWIGAALQARFPILFVDEYQDLGYALHHLVLNLCFQSGIRLFAVGDADQSIYRFNGANPDLLLGLSERPDVCSIRLRYNYRCGRQIIDASMAALGEERGYEAPDGAHEGEVFFKATDGDLGVQASDIVQHLLPEIRGRQIPVEEVAILYRTANEGSAMAAALAGTDIPFVRADNHALVRRNSRLSRFIEACARWAAGGWKSAQPRFRRLTDQAINLVLGTNWSFEEEQAIQLELICFLKNSIDAGHSTHAWLLDFRDTLIRPWKQRAREITEDWDVIDAMIDRTDPTGPDGDLPLAHFGGFFEGSGRLNLSTLHSAKGREFDAVILFAMNNDVIPSRRDQRRADDLREARRLFYVGVTRARHELHVCFRRRANSPFVRELYDRLNSDR